MESCRLFGMNFEQKVVKAQEEFVGGRRDFNFYVKMRRWVKDETRVCVTLERDIATREFVRFSTL